MTNDKPNILCLFETTSGLGHLRRSSGIANALADQGANVYVASGTLVDTKNFFRPNVIPIHLPPHHIQKNDGNWYYYNEDGNFIKNASFNPDVWKQQRKDMLVKAVSEHPPHAMIAEFWPFTRKKDLTHLVMAIKREGRHHKVDPIVFSSVRDILETKDTMRMTVAEKAAKESDTVQKIEKYVDHVMIHGDPRLVQFQDGFQSYGDIEHKVRYTGYVVNDRAKEKNRHRKLVVVSAGSGSTGEDLFTNVLKAREYSKLRHHKWMIVLGPRLGDHKGEQISTLDERIRRKNKFKFQTEIYNHREDLPDLLTQADFSISLAGYNTTLEVLASEVKSVLIPKFKERTNGEIWIDEEQRSRLAKLHTQDMAVMVEPADTHHPKKFAELIDNAYDIKRKKSPLDMNGAANTAQFVLEKVKQRFGTTGLNT